MLPTKWAYDFYQTSESEEFLRETIERHPVVKIALYVSSPDLWNAIEPWLRGGGQLKPKELAKLSRYLVRMSMRTTPFGLSAGVGLTELSAATSTGISLLEGRAVLRPDLGWLTSYVRSLEEDEHLRPSLWIVASDMVVERGARLYILCDDQARPGMRNDFLPEFPAISVTLTPLVRESLRFCARSKPISELVDHLADTFQAARDDIASAVEAMIRNGLFFFTHRPIPILDPLDHTLSELRKAGATEPVAKLERIRSLCNDLSRSPSAITVDDIQHLDEAVRAVHDDGSRRLQVDLHRPAAGAIPRIVARDLMKMARYSIICAQAPNLGSFTERFLERYGGSERLVPLLELVSSELGLGFEYSMLRLPKLEASVRLRLSSLINRSLRARCAEVQLTEDELKSLFTTEANEKLPESIEMSCEIWASDIDSINEGRYIVVPGAMHYLNGCHRTLGRFSHLFPVDELGKIVERVRSRDGSWVDLTYMPHNKRILNVGSRQRVHERQIEVGLNTGSPGRIPLSDLFVGLANGRFFLFSKQLDQTLTPDEFHVTNPAAGNPIVRFLSLFARDGVRFPRAFDFLTPDDYEFFPRVAVGRCVLGLARWKIHRSELTDVSRAEKALESRRGDYFLPRMVSLVEGDAKLFIDLDSTAARDMLVHSARDKHVEFLTLEEGPVDTAFWLDGEQSVNDAKYRGEIVYTVGIRSRSTKDDATAPIARPIETRPHYTLGSEYVYTKWYCGQKTADLVLGRCVGPLARHLSDLGLVSLWFFVRYADQRGPHLRLRFKAGRHWQQVFEECRRASADATTAGLIEISNFDAYEPEFERYGGESGLRLAEAIWHEDSIVTIDSVVASSDDPQARVLHCAESALDILKAFPLECAQSWMRHANHVVRKLPIEYRSRVSEISRRPRKQLHFSAQIDRETAEMLSDPDKCADYLSSIIHLHCNRWALAADQEILVNTIVRAALVSQRAREEPAKIAYVSS